MGEELHGTLADKRTAAVFYGSTFVAVSFAFNALWLWAAHGRRLIEPGVPQSSIDGHTRRTLLNIPTFAVATLVALWSPEVALILYGIIAVSYLLPYRWLDDCWCPNFGRPTRKTTRKEPTRVLDPPPTRSENAPIPS